MGELLYLSALSGSTEFTEATEATLMDAMRRFCRSIELCDGYLRGYYGLKIVSRPASAVMAMMAMMIVLTNSPGHKPIAYAGFKDSIGFGE